MEWRKHKTKLIVLPIVVIIIFYGVYSIAAEAAKEDKGKIAEIEIDGVISHSKGSSGLLSQSRITPAQVKDLVEKAKKDKVDGYLFKINSPGGAAVASRDLARVIENIDKPTTCLMQEVAASGAYWTATECDQIFADALSITGSIGVSSTYLQYSGLLKEYGVDYVNLTAGEYKDIRSPYKDLASEERDILQKQLDKVHEIFKEDIAENRNLSMEEMDNYGTGQTFLGEKAQEIGLVDQIGRKENAMEHLEDVVGKELETKKYEKESSFNFLSLLPVKIGYGIGKALTETGQDFKGIEARYAR